MNSSSGSSKGAGWGHRGGAGGGASSSSNRSGGFQRSRSAGFGGGIGGSSTAAELAELHRQEPGPLYFFHGEEQFLVSRAIDILKDKVLGSTNRQLNLDEWQGREFNGEKALTIASTYPMFSKMRLLLIRDVDIAPQSELQKLIPYLDDPAPTCCLIAVSSKSERRGKATKSSSSGKSKGAEGAPAPRKRAETSFVSAMMSRAKVIEFQTLWQNQVSSWISDWAAQKGLRIDDMACDQLAEIAGNNLAVLDDSLDRLSLYAGPGAQSITSEHVRECIADSRAHTMLDLGEALGNRNREEALKILYKLRTTGEAPLALLGSLAKKLRDFWLIREAQSSGASMEEIKRVVGTRSDWYCNKLVGHARHFSSEDFISGTIAVHKADVQLKSSRLPGKLNEWVVLEEVVQQLCPK